MTEEQALVSLFTTICYILALAKKFLKKFDKEFQHLVASDAGIFFQKDSHGHVFR